MVDEIFLLHVWTRSHVTCLIRWLTTSASYEVALIRWKIETIVDCRCELRIGECWLVFSRSGLKDCTVCPSAEKPIRNSNLDHAVVNDDCRN